MKDLNLLPQKYVKINKARQEFMITIAIALSAIALITVIYSGMLIYHNNLSNENDELLDQIQHYSIVNNVINQNEILKSGIGVREQFLKDIDPKIQVFNYSGYIAGCIPKGSGVKLTSLTYDSNNVTLNIKINDYDSLSKYVKRIRNTALFLEVKIQSAAKDDKGKITAAIVCSINKAN